MSKFAFSVNNEQAQTGFDATHRALSEEGWRRSENTRAGAKYEHPDKPGHRVIVSQNGNEVEWKHYDKPKGMWKNSGSIGPGFSPTGAHGEQYPGNHSGGLRRSIT